MGIQLFANNATTNLAGSITGGSTSITVSTGTGSLFPSPTGSQFFLATLQAGLTVEIVKVTARSGDVMTVTRAQEGTVASSFGPSAVFEMRATAATLTNLIQNSEDTAAYITSYGAVGDGTTDNTSAIQAAIDANKGGTIIIPNGTFLAAGVILADSSYNGTKLISVGGVLKIKADGGSTNFGGAWVGLILGTADNLVVDVIMDGNRSNMTASQHIYCLGVAGTTHSKIRLNCQELRGDGLYISQASWTGSSADPSDLDIEVIAHNSADDGRNAVSLISGKRISLGVISHQVGGIISATTMPGGIDIEPDHTYQTCADITIKYANITTAGSTGFQIFGQAVTSDATRDWNCARIKLSNVKVVKTGTSGSSISGSNLYRVRDLTIESADISYSAGRGQGWVLDYADRVQANLKVSTVNNGIQVGPVGEVRDFDVRVAVDDYSVAGLVTCGLTRGRFTGRIGNSISVSSSSPFAIQASNSFQVVTSQQTDVTYMVDAPYDGVNVRAFRNESTHPCTFVGCTIQNCNFSGYASYPVMIDQATAVRPFLKDVQGTENTAQPSNGAWQQGEFIRNSTPSAGGTTVKGWTRLTTGTANVAGTDWNADYVLTAATVPLSSMASLAANSIIGNNTGSPATPLALTTAQVKTLLGYYTSGDSPSFNTLTLTTALAFAQGGTGQITQQAALNALAGAVTTAQYLRGNGTNVVLSAIQAGDVPTLNQNTSGTAAGLSSTLAIASGGTGQVTANAAFNALAPSQASASGKYLTSNGTDTSWATVVAGVTGSGASTQLATWSGTTALTGSSTLIWTAGGHLLIGTGTDNTTNIVQIVDTTTANPPVQLAVKNTNANGGAGVRYATTSGDWYTYASASNPPAWKIDNGGSNYFQLYPDGAGNPNFTFTGGVAWARRHAVADTNYAISSASTDYLIAFTSLTAARTTTLPGAAGVGPGQVIIVKDESGSCSATNTITILTSSGNTIDGQSSHVLSTPYACVTLYANSSQWFVKYLGTQLASSTLPGLVSSSAQTFGGAKTTSQWIAEASGGGSVFWRDTAAGSNLKLWQSTVDTTHNALSFYPTNDANNSILTWPLAMFRSGRVAIGSTSGSSPTDDTINSLQIQGATRSLGNLTVGSYLGSGANAILAINPGRTPYSWPLEVWSGTTQTDGAAKTTILAINNDIGFASHPEAGISFFGLINNTSGWASFGAISAFKENTTSNDHAGTLRFCTSTSGSGSETEAMRINSSQRVLIGTTTDNGVDNVQVNGSLSVSQGSANKLAISGSSSTNPTTITATGSDINIAIKLVPKGAGAVQCGQVLLIGTGVDIAYPYSTIAGSPGNGTVNNASGRAAIANGASSVTVTSSVVGTSSIVHVQNEALASGIGSLAVTVSAGSFTVTNLVGGVAAPVTADAIFSFICAN